MKLTLAITTLTILSLFVTVAWVAGLRPSTLGIEAWWNVGLLLAAALVTAWARLRPLL